MTTTPDYPTAELPGRPPIVDLATWQSARDELLIREKAHTHEGDAIAAARRRLPMVEVDGTVEVVGPDGPVPFLDLFQGRDELVVYQHMWYDDAPHQGQCEGCTTSTTGRGNEPANGSFGLPDMTPYGRGEAWEDNPEGRTGIGDVREGHPSVGNQACWYWRSDAAGNPTWGPTSRPVPQWTRPGATPEETLGRHGHHH